MSNEVFRDKIEKCIIRVTDSVTYCKRYNYDENEKDTYNRLEKELWLQISSTFLGSMSSVGAWVTYRNLYYYNKMTSEEEKQQVSGVLLSMLKSNKYDMTKKAVIAYVCADLVISEAEDEIVKLSKIADEPKDKSMFERSVEALKKGISINEYVAQII